MEHSKKMYTFSLKLRPIKMELCFHTERDTMGKAKNPRFRSYGELLGQKKKNRSKISFNIMVAAPGIQDRQE